MSNHNNTTQHNIYKLLTLIIWLIQPINDETLT